jgi:hypothetical protein
MNLFNWNKKQLDEALGEVNRYYFWEKYQREPFDRTELILYYVEAGGALNFARKNGRQEVQMPLTWETAR